MGHHKVLIWLKCSAGIALANCRGMRHNQTPTAEAASEAHTAREEVAMGDLRARRIFFSLVLGAAVLIGALEVALARSGNPIARPSAPWMTPLEDMDCALAGADFAAAAAARHRAPLAAPAGPSRAG